MKKLYSIRVEFEDWIDVEAESEEEAIRQAKHSAYWGDMKATVEGVCNVDE